TTATYITSSTPPHLLLFFLLLSVFFHSTYPSVLFFFNATAPTEIYTLSLHDALPISVAGKDLERFSDLVAGDDVHDGREHPCRLDRKSTRLNSSHGSISYAVFCLKKKNKKRKRKKYLDESGGVIRVW